MAMTTQDWKNLFANNTIDTVNYNNSSVSKVVVDGSTVWEAWKSSYFSFNTYHRGGGASFGADDTYDVGKPVRAISSTLTSVNNKGNSPTYVLYGSTNNSNWIELGRISHGGGAFTINVTNKNLFRYFKIHQSESQWRRDDGNEVCSIEPWRVDYLYK